MQLMKLLQLRDMEPVDATVLLSVAFAIYHRLPESLTIEIARHTLDDPDDPDIHIPFAELELYTSPEKKIRKRFIAREKTIHRTMRDQRPRYVLLGCT